MSRVRIFLRWLRGSVSRLRFATVAMPGLSARGTQPALRVQQKHAGGHNTVAGLQARTHLHAIGKLHTQRHGPGLEAIPDGDKHVLLPAGVDDGIARNGHRGKPDGFERCGSVQTRPQHSSRVRDREPHPQRARPLGQRGVKKVDTGRKWLPS